VAGVVRMGVVELVVSMRTRSGEHIMAAICRPHTFDPSILLANASTKISFHYLHIPPWPLQVKASPLLKPPSCLNSHLE
jgi:hypothetical protein